MMTNLDQWQETDGHHQLEAIGVPGVPHAARHDMPCIGYATICHGLAHLAYVPYDMPCLVWFAECH